MPSGKVHAAATTLAAIATPLLLDPHSPQAMAGGSLAGLILTPDLDIERKTHAHSMVKKLGREVGRKSGKILGESLAFLW